MRRIDLIVEEYGLKLGRTGGRLTVRRGGEVVQELPLQLVRLLQTVARDVTARLDAPADFGPRRARVGACMQQGVRTVGAFLRGDGELRLFRWDVRGPKEPSAVRDPLERFFKRIDDREA